MNTFHDSHNGSRDMVPLMVMPSGQVIFWARPQPYQADYSRPQSVIWEARDWGVKHVALVLAALAAPVALLAAYVATF